MIQLWATNLTVIVLYYKNEWWLYIAYILSTVMPDFVFTVY